MSIIAIYKTAAAVVLGETFAHYEVLPNGALMFGGKRAYEEGKFLKVSKQGACFTNPFGVEPDKDVTADFKAVVNRLQEADAAEGEQAVKLFIETNVAIGAAGFVGADDMLAEEHIIATILWQKLLNHCTWEEVKEMAEDAKRTGEDSFVPHALTDLDVIQAVAAFTETIA